MLLVVSKKTVALFREYPHTHTKKSIFLRHIQFEVISYITSHKSNPQILQNGILFIKDLQTPKKITTRNL